MSSGFFWTCIFSFITLLISELSTLVFDFILWTFEKGSVSLMCALHLLDPCTELLMCLSGTLMLLLYNTSDHLQPSASGPDRFWSALRTSYWWPVIWPMTLKRIVFAARWCIWGMLNGQILIVHFNGSIKVCMPVFEWHRKKCLFQYQKLI